MVNLIQLWILASVVCTTAGWILSAFHALHTLGFAVFLTLAGLGMGIWIRLTRASTSGEWQARGWMRRYRRRFGRLLPMIYALALVIAIVGGSLYAPRNYDALSYRFPRIMHWWAASSWHWIQTPNDRMNLSGTGFEWMMMPLFAFTHSDRLFFLINVAAYILMPGLVFGVFTGLGVPRRQAWYWMWLLPLAPCYLMQAGSICNDSYAVTYMLASIWFGLRAARTGRVSDLWMAILAGALLTGVKGSNLPLPLAVGWALWPAFKLVRLRPISSLIVLLLAVLVSYVPTAVFNQIYTGHWTGDPHNQDHLQIQKPLAGIVGNSLQLAAQSLEPPFFPVASTAQNWIMEHLPRGVRSMLEQSFPIFNLGLRELPLEESSGLGLGVTLIAVLSLFGAITAWRSNPPKTWLPAARHGVAIGLLAWVSLLAYMIKLGSDSTGRLLAAYYPLLLLPILVRPSPNRRELTHGRQVLAAWVGATALMAAVLNPSRPLWPAQSILKWFSDQLPGRPLIARAQDVYSIYASRNDIFGGLRAHIPDSVITIGVIQASADMESSLWRPFGRRIVVDLMDYGRDKPLNVEWVVVRNVLVINKSRTFEQWIHSVGATLVYSQTVIPTAHGGPEEWSVIRYTGIPAR